MNNIITSDFYHTSKLEKRGYIDPHALRELWFHTGTACNLSCPFCLEGSKPGDDRLQRVTLEDVKPYIDEACELGVEQFSFTGGEPFVVKDLGRILEYAASLKPCLVLTNGTDAVLNREKTLKKLSDTHFPIAFRVSIDYPDEQLHDEGRGAGSFKQSMQGLQLLHGLGFKVSVARQAKKEENPEAVNTQYRRLFGEYALPEDLTIIAFPDFMPPFASAAIPEITESCMTQYHSTESRASFMCAFSKMLVKQDGEMKIYSCTLVDDDPRYAQSGKLKDSLHDRVMMTHHRCYSCFSFGASCSEI
jgi:sulfatase maturation enzyme AslB (radical SAM superfamily)